MDDEYLALMALLSIGERFYAGGAPLSLKELARIFNDQESLAARTLEALQKCGLVTQVADQRRAKYPEVYAQPASRADPGKRCPRLPQARTPANVQPSPGGYKSLLKSCGALGGASCLRVAGFKPPGVSEYVPLKAGQISTCLAKIQTHPGITFFSR